MITCEVPCYVDVNVYVGQSALCYHSVQQGHASNYFVSDATDVFQSGVCRHGMVSRSGGSG